MEFELQLFMPHFAMKQMEGAPAAATQRCGGGRTRAAITQARLIDFEGVAQ
jgi:hypothetical protein